ncbi:fatty acid desaturase family protein [Pleionea sediminis]|uniref:fatty acid desaturase family protein n=1 Tax=Pleionea sediminis TaxID=2569479 RepID=UPI0011855668|nr:fatty acid desaturase [Pleionea sediminis]
MEKQQYVKLLEQVQLEDGFAIHSSLALTISMLELAMIAGCLFLLTIVEPFGWQFWLIEIFLGLSMFRCFVLLHECGHGTFFKSNNSNVIMGSLFGAIALVPFVSWRNVHRKHHKWVGVIDKDPTSVAALDAQEYSSAMRMIVRVMWVLRLPVAAAIGIFSAFWMYPGRLLKETKVDRHKLLLSILSAVITLLPWGALAVLIGLENFLIYALPALFIFYFWFETINLCHHAGLYPFISHSHPNSIKTYEQEAYCRSAMLPRWLSIVCCYNFNLHTEHHIFPTVPWSYLNRLSELMDECGLENYHKQSLPSLVRDIRRLDPFDDIIDKAPSRLKQSMTVDT